MARKKTKAASCAPAERKTKQWHLRSADINTVVNAKDQFEAWDSLRDRPASDFGLVTSAEPNEVGDDDSFPIRTSILMFRWHRDSDAKRFIARGISEGMPDTTEQDLIASGRKDE